MNTSPQPSSCSPQSGFDPLKHNPPRYDIYGFLKQNKHFTPKASSNILCSIPNLSLLLKLPNKADSEAKTQTKLFESRRQARLPDPSFDLDKDGYVSGRDLVIAKRFDKDGDGKLNEKEKAAAYDAINNQHIESNFIWDVDAQGKTRPFRLLQKRGVIVDCDDFLPVQSTYPEHPNKKFIPRASTYTDLKELRSKELKNAINGNTQRWEKSISTAVNETNGSSSARELKPNPTNRSIKDIKAKMHREARMKCGLTEVETDLKVTSKDPSLAYVSEPRHRTISDIREDLHQKDKEEAGKLTNRTFKDDITRLNEREEEILDKLYHKGEAKTLTKVKEERKKDILNYNMKVFSSGTIGVHGHDLPKFSRSQSIIDFWKNADEYKETPHCSSQAQLKEEMKYWKKPEELLLSDHREYTHSTDPYQRTYERKQQKDNIIPKLNKINVFKGFDPNHPRPIQLNSEHQCHTYRWTTLVHQFAPNKFKKGRLFDSISPDNLKHSSFKLDLMHNVSPDLDFFNKKNKEDKKKLEGSSSSEVELKLPKDNLYQRFSMSPSGSEGNILLKTIPIKTKAF